MPNYKLTIQYDGTDYFGWQSQPSKNTIQDIITASINQITQENVNLIGSGRTDSGVHAFGQVANFHCEKTIDEYKFLHALNSLLPKSISIKNIQIANDNFHSRFDAVKRSYLYFLSKNKSPFYERYSYQFPYISKIDIASLIQISNLIIGEHDFTSFCKVKTETENKICTIYNIGWKEKNDLILFNIEANRFLHGMVRAIVGTLLNSLKFENRVQYLKDVLESKDRQVAGEAVPAKGLFLYKVKY